MVNFTRKLLVSLLCVCILVSFVPTSVYADELFVQEPAQAEDQAASTSEETPQDEVELALETQETAQNDEISQETSESVLNDENNSEDAEDQKDSEQTSGTKTEPQLLDDSQSVQVEEEKSVAQKKNTEKAETVKEDEQEEPVAVAEPPIEETDQEDVVVSTQSDETILTESTNTDESIALEATETTETDELVGATQTEATETDNIENIIEATSTEATETEATKTEIKSEPVVLKAGVIGDPTVSVVITADPGVYPEGELYVLAQIVQDSYVIRKVNEAVDSVSEDTDVARRITYDIKVLFEGNEVQPDTSKGSAKVAFVLNDVPSGADGVSVYHVSDDSKAETVNATVINDFDCNHEADCDCEIHEDTLAEVLSSDAAEAVAEQVSEVNADTVIVADTPSFSYYTVDFTYNEKTISIPGDSDANLLSDILNAVGITEEITDVQVYNDADCTDPAEGNKVYNDNGEELFSIYQVEGIWYAKATTAFDTTHGILVSTINGEYKIKVTDDTTATISVKSYNDPTRILTNTTSSGVTNYFRMSELLEVSWDGFTDNSKVSLTYSVTKSSGTFSVSDGKGLEIFCTSDMYTGNDSGYYYDIKDTTAWSATNNSWKYMALSTKGITGDESKINVTITASDGSKSASITLTGFAAYDLEKDINNTIVLLFEKETRTLKDLYGLAGVVHIDCGGSTAYIKSSGDTDSSVIELGKTSGSSNYDTITGVSAGQTTIKTSVKKDSCSHHSNSDEETGNNAVVVVKKVSTYTDETATFEGGIPAGVKYTLNGQTLTSNGTDPLVFEDLSPNTTYTYTVTVTVASITSIRTDTFTTLPLQSHNIYIQNSGNSNGNTFTADHTTATKGTSVGATATPKTGYVTKSIEVTKNSSSAVTVASASDTNTLNFTMPGYDVLVSAEFVKEWTYSAGPEPNELQVTNYPDGTVQKMSITSPTNLVYDGNEKPAALVFEPSTLTTFGDKPIEDITIKYYQYNGSKWELCTTPTNVGQYKAVASVTDADGNVYEISTEYSITKSEATLTNEPSGVTLPYNGLAQVIGNAGTPDGGTLNYSIGTSLASGTSWQTNIPTATNVGTYYIWYYVKGDTNHTDTQAAYVISYITPTNAGDDAASDTDKAKVASISNATYTSLQIKPEPVVTAPNGDVLVKDVDYTLTYGTNTDAGQGTVVVEYIKNYSGTTTIEFEIYPELAVIDWDVPADLTYSGNEKEVTASVTNVKGTDVVNVALEGATATNVGNYVTTATSLDNPNYILATPNPSVNWEITSKNIGQASPTSLPASVSDIPDYVYTGSAITPAPEVYDETRILSSGTDYDVTYENNVNVGTATAVINFKGNYSGTVRKDFQITPLDASSLASISDIPDEVYSGDAKEPHPTVEVNGVQLSSGTDFSYDYTSNTNVGTATVIINFEGNYKGSTSTNFNILEAQPDVTEPVANDLTYNGQLQNLVQAATSTTGTPQYYVGTSVPSTDSDWSYEIPTATNAGTYTIWYRIEGDSNHSNTDPASLTSVIKQKVVDIKWTTPSNLVYDKTHKIPGVESSNTETGDELYVTATLTDLNDNVNVGTFTFDAIELTGASKDNYKLPSDITSPGYTITAKNLGTDASGTNASGTDASGTNVFIKNIPDQVYTGSPIEPQVIVEDDGYTLEYGKDYSSTTYIENTDVGTATAIVAFTGNYTGTGYKNFSITPWSVGDDAATETDKAKIEPIPAQTYTGSEITPPATITDKTGKILELGKDYKITGYASNTDIGTATMYIEFIGNYTGTAETTFEIVKKNIGDDAATETDKAKVDPIPDETYTSSPIKPGVTVWDGIKELASGTDYKITGYASNTDAGTATVYIEFIGNYGGKISKTFTIEPATIGIEWTIPTGNQAVYNGQQKTVTAVATGLCTDTDVVNITLDGDTAVDAGDYVATATQLDNPNYQLPAVTYKEWTIEKSPQSLSTSDVYDLAYDKDYNPVITLRDTDTRADNSTIVYELSEDATFDTILTPDVNGQFTLQAGDDHKYYVRKASDSNYFESNFRQFSLPEAPVVRVEVTVLPPDGGVISVTYGEGTATNAITDTAKVRQGEELTLAATPTQGYKFIAWYWNGGSSTATNVVINVNGDTEVSARFAKEAATLVDWPTLNQPLYYTGYPQQGYDPSTSTDKPYVLVEGPSTATDAGLYEITIALPPGYVWPDGTDEPLTYVWEIKKATPTTPEFEKPVVTEPESIVPLSTTTNLVFVPADDPLSTPTNVEDLATPLNLPPGTYYFYYPGDPNHEASKKIPIVVKPATPLDVTVKTEVPSGIKYTEVTLRGTNTGSPTSIGFELWLTGHKTDGITTYYSSYTANGFEAFLTDLATDTSYTYRAYAIASGSNTRIYGDTYKFRTEAPEETSNSPAASTPTSTPTDQMSIEIFAGTLTDAKVTIEDGNTIISERDTTTSTPTSDGKLKGEVTFNKLPDGYYNVVVRTPEYTETRMIEVKEGKINEVKFDVPEGNLETKVLIKTEDTPNVAVERLPDIIRDQQVDEAAVARGELDVEIKLDVLKIDDNSTDAIKIQQIKDANEVLDLYLDLTLSKETTEYDYARNILGMTLEDIGSTNNIVLEIAVPYESGLGTPVAYRCHNGIAEKLLALETRPTVQSNFIDGTYFVEDGYVFIYASGFSTYAIGYELLPAEQPDDPAIYKVEGPDTEGGKITVNRKYVYPGEEIIVTVTPDEGYELEDIKVIDKSGKEITLTKNADGTYSFNMPWNDVTVVATFKEIEKEETDWDAWAKEMAKKLRFRARSVYTPKNNVRVRLVTNKTADNILNELKEHGFTVKFKYYRSTKKDSKYTRSYQLRMVKKGRWYLNNIGEYKTMYYYRIRAYIYNQDGKLVATTALKQCKYANRQWRY